MLLQKRLKPPHQSLDLDSIAVSSLSSVPSPSLTSSGSSSQNNIRTNAFFASPFSTRPSSPNPAVTSPPTKGRTGTLGVVKNDEPKPVPPRSLTADFFDKGKTNAELKTFETSRRNFLNLELKDNALQLGEIHTSPLSLSFNIDPPLHSSPESAIFDTSDEPTPRPPPVIMNLSHPPGPSSPKPILPPITSLGVEEDAEVVFSEYASSISSDSGLVSIDSERSLLHHIATTEQEDELTPGAIIRTSSLDLESRAPSPYSSHGSPPNSGMQSLGTGNLSVAQAEVNHTSSSFSSSVTLRLAKPLGRGSFSSVWLAQDLSPTPLLLKSKRSLRDLRQKEIEGASRGGPDLGRLKVSKPSSSLMRRLRGGISGTRPGGGGPGSGFLSPETQRHGTIGSQWDGMPMETLTDPTPFKLLNRFGQNLGVDPVDHVDVRNRLSSIASSTGLPIDETEGISPVPSIIPLPQDGPISLSRASSVSWKSVSEDGEGSVPAAGGGSSKLKRTRSAAKRLVAVKVTLRGVIESPRGAKGRAEEERERDRTRVSFVREVEILKHISHPNITPLLSHLTTLTHHVLVLPYLPGGDLLALVNGPGWNNLNETILRRIFSELCKAVGWMHSVGLAHRDIKLENILLTTPLYISPTNTSPPTSPLYQLSPIIPPPSQALIQLTDFGLSRFFDPQRPLLTTRCGSEAYAAPELVVNGGRRGVASSHILWGLSSESSGNGGNGPGGYDPRETDAWACGVVLYELVARKLPFGEGPGEVTSHAAAAERRQWLVRIAKGEWVWPDHGKESHNSPPSPSAETEFTGVTLVRSAGARRIVERLLVRDPSKRARIDELWDDDWLSTASFASETLLEDSLVKLQQLQKSEQAQVQVEVQPVLEKDITLPGDPEDDHDDDDDNHDGWLVDKDSMHDIASQEVI